MPKRITEILSISTSALDLALIVMDRVLVLHNILGLFERFLPKFAKRYADLRVEALKKS